MFAIECNPRTHSAITMFYDHPGLADAYLRRRGRTVVRRCRAAARRTGSTTRCGGCSPSRDGVPGWRTIARRQGRDLRPGRPAAVPARAPPADPVAAAAEPARAARTGCGSTSTSASSSRPAGTDVPTDSHRPARPAPGRLGRRATSTPTCPGSTPRTAWPRRPTRSATSSPWPTSHPDGRWRFPADLAARRSRGRAEPGRGRRRPRTSATWHLDVAVPQMFCLPGHDVLPGAARRARHPVRRATPPDVMALGAHKARARAVVAAAGVPVPAGEVLRARRAARPCRRPRVVKPVDADNSLGVALVRDPAEYDAALATGLRRRRRGARRGLRRARPRGPLRGRSSGTASWSACRWRSTPSTRDTKPIRDARRQDPAAATTADLAWWPRTPTHAWIVDPDDPVTERGVGGGAGAATGRWAAGDYSLFDFRIDPDGRAVVPRGRALLLLRPHERGRGDGRGGRRGRRGAVRDDAGREPRLTPPSHPPRGSPRTAGSRADGWTSGVPQITPAYGRRVPRL